TPRTAGGRRRPARPRPPIAATAGHVVPLRRPYGTSPAPRGRRYRRCGQFPVRPISAIIAPTTRQRIGAGRAPPPAPPHPPGPRRRPTRTRRPARSTRTPRRGTACGTAASRRVTDQWCSSERPLRRTTSPGTLRLPAAQRLLLVLHRDRHDRVVHRRVGPAAA